MNNLLLEISYRHYLQTLPVLKLRVIARYFGVEKVTQYEKNALIEFLIDSLENNPFPPVNLDKKKHRGAPPKHTEVSPEIFTMLAQIRRNCEEAENLIGVASPEYEDRLHAGNDILYRGILELMPTGYGFLRVKNCQPSTRGLDVFVPPDYIRDMKLREGDEITCTASRGKRSGSPSIEVLGSVNGSIIGMYEQRPRFENLMAQYSDEKLVLSGRNSDLTLRLIDLFVPIGKGQRGIIVAPPKAGKTTLLKKLAAAIAESYPDIELNVLLIDERPEEVTDFVRSVPNARVIYSNFDENAESHIRAVRLVVEHCKRLVEQGKDAVILLDSLTKLTRAFNITTESTGKTLSGGLEANALAEAKKCFGVARNTVDQGSLTVLATVLVDTGSRMDEVIYEEFKGTGNSDIILSETLAERRIYPALDLRRSGTRKEEMLLSEKELSAVSQLRALRLTEDPVALYEMMEKTQDNAEFLARLPEWLRVYKGK